MSTHGSGLLVGECLEFGWEEFKARAADYVLALFVLILPFAVLQGVIGYSQLDGLEVVRILIPAMIWTCSMSLAHRVASGAKPDLDDAFRPFTERQGDYLIVCAAMSAGFIAFGVGVLVTWFLCLFAPLLVLEGRDFKAALVTSKDLVLQHRGALARLSAVIFLLNIIGALPFGLGLLVSLPVTTLAVVKAQRLLASQLAVSEPTDAPPVMPQPPL